MTEVKVTKRKQAADLFDEMLEAREEGKFKTNRDFRAAVINRLMDELDISNSSACSMYGTNKRRVCQQDPTLGLGRDPKPGKPVVKIVVPGDTAVDEDELLDQAVVTDTSGVVDLDPLASLDELLIEDYDDLHDFMGNGDVGGGDYM